MSNKNKSPKSSKIKESNVDDPKDTFNKELDEENISRIEKVQESCNEIETSNENLEIRVDRLRYRLCKDFIRFTVISKFQDIRTVLEKTIIYKDFALAISHFITYIINYVKSDSSFPALNKTIPGLRMLFSDNDTDNVMEDLDFSMFRLSIMQEFNLSHESMLYIFYLCEIMSWSNVFYQGQKKLNWKEKCIVVETLRKAWDRLDCIEFEEFGKLISTAERYLSNKWKVPDKIEKISGAIQYNWGGKDEQHLDYSIQKFISKLDAFLKKK